MKPLSQKFIQKRKFLMALPILILPFLTMFFWALGGGAGDVGAKTEDMKGLNPSLPSAQFDDEANAWDKLSLYQKARRDSLKMGQAKRSDPYFKLSTLKVKKDTIKPDSLKRNRSINTSLGVRREPIDDTETKVYQRLEELQRQIDQPVAKNDRKSSKPARKGTVEDARFQSDVDRLESMMVMMQQGQEEDKEMQEINEVLNKIIDIQHPELVKQRLAEHEDNNEALSAEAKLKGDNISIVGERTTLQSMIEGESNGFYGLESKALGVSESNAIKAEIYGDQTLVAGSVVKIVLLQDISVGGVTIPKNQFVFGVCALNNERLTIKVNSVEYKNSIYPVSLSVHDIDGLEGIYMPGTIARDAAKRSSNQAIQDIQLNSLDPSLELQAASAGIEAAKGILSKKARMIRVTVKAGYQVYLVNKNAK
jgi:conjugative transposon TraM protein